MHSSSKSILCEFIRIDNYEEFRSTKSVDESSFFFIEYIASKRR